MSKIKIIVNSEDPVTFHQHYLRPEIQKYVDIVDYYPGITVVGQKCLVMTSVCNQHNWYNELVDQGAKIIRDSFWERHVSDQYAEQYRDSGLVVSCKNYFWVNEYFVNLNRGLVSYTPSVTQRRTHRALLPIRQTKPHRQQLLTALSPWLDIILYSQVDQGKLLPNDASLDDGNFQRHFNPEWYQNTYFSIVSETTTFTKYKLHVTEKTFKPLAFFHPFVVFGQPGILEHLHQLGFETFENLFDESYDSNPDQNSRLRQVIENVVYFLERDYDNLTWKKISHNNALFNNTDRIKAMLYYEILKPIMEYAETR